MNYISKISDAGRLLRDGYVVYELDESKFFRLQALVEELCSYIISKKEISDPFVKEWIDVIPEVFFTDYIDFLKIDVTEFVFSHEDRLKKLSYTRFRELYKRKNT